MGMHRGAMAVAMAMVARAFGYGEGMTDAQLILDLGRKGGTSANGTDVGGIARMADAIGLQSETRGPGAQVDWIAQALAAGIDDRGVERLAFTEPPSNRIDQHDRVVDHDSREDHDANQDQYIDGGAGDEQRHDRADQPHRYRKHDDQWPAQRLE